MYVHAYIFYTFNGITTYICTHVSIHTFSSTHVKMSHVMIAVLDVTVYTYVHTRTQLHSITCCVLYITCKHVQHYNCTSHGINALYLTSYSPPVALFTYSCSVWQDLLPLSRLLTYDCYIYLGCILCICGKHKQLSSLLAE